jgi:hypothetical protein
MEFRKKDPQRSTEVEYQSDYHKYRDQLRSDFSCRCGYCDDVDYPRVESYEIDHFVPVTIDKNKETDYNNLVYACRSCNNAKRKKWPTNDSAKFNNGKEGWIDPCDSEYSRQFERDSYGAITPKTEIGKWMYENLNLWKSQHSLLWCIENIGKKLDELDNLYAKSKDSDILQKINKINHIYRSMMKRLYEL